jgi:uncharacterized lipoprotein YmbA
MTLKTFKRIVWLPVLMALSGCINTPLPDYYVLTPERDAAAQAGELSIVRDIALGIGPITIPETVNRPNIVTPLDNNQLDVAEYHRWSEPLIENISRVVITNLSARTDLNKLYAYPWLGNRVDYQVRIDVLQMTGSPAEQVQLQVRWQILNGDKPAKLITTRIVDYTEEVSADGYSPLVAAYSRVVGRLSDDIADTLAKVEFAQSKNQ